MTTFNQPYIREDLTIDDKVQKFYDSCTGDGPVVLLGRIVKHATTLRVHRQPLIIVADVYDGTSGIIDARGLNSGAVGARGADGVYPWPNYDLITEAPTGPGGDGGQGGDGGPGGNGVAVTVYCRQSINAGVSAVGGIGAPGGAGGNGGRGVDGFTIPDQVVWVDDTPDDLSDFSGHEELIPGRTVDGTPGGNGGGGGNGGNGGNRGTIIFTSIVDDTLPTLDVRGGVGGPGGAGGAAGVDGALSQSAAGEGLTGLEGGLGAEGQATQTTSPRPTTSPACAPSWTCPGCRTPTTGRRSGSRSATTSTTGTTRACPSGSGSPSSRRSSSHGRSSFSPTTERHSDSRRNSSGSGRRSAPTTSSGWAGATTLSGSRVTSMSNPTSRPTWTRSSSSATSRWASCPWGWTRSSSP